MKIAICDDEACFVNTIYQYLWNEQNCTIETFLSAEELWKQYENGIRYDVIFCDIMMQPLNGIELAHKIRTLDNNVILVYLTNNLEFAPLGYEVRAFRYLLKPIHEKDFLSVMEEIRREQKKEKKLLFETSIGSLLIPESSIVYMEAFDKDIQIFYNQDSFYVKRGLNELEETLTNHCFFRIHRKYLIHLDHVLEYDNSKVTLDCGKTLPVSRRKSKAFRESMESFIKGA